MKQTSKGIICIILSAFCFALMAAFVRLSGEINFIQKGFFRNSVAFLIALFLLLKDVIKNGKEPITIPKGAWIFLFLRSAAGSIGIFGNFYAVDNLVLSDAAILNKMSPFFAVIFSIFLIREKLKLPQLLTVLGAFVGAILIIKPSVDFTKMIPTLAGFASGMGAGFAYSCVRKLSSLKCSGKIVVLFFSAFSMLLSIPFIAVNFEPMTVTQVLLLIGSGIAAAGGQFGITAAYYYAPAREISVYDYSQIIFSAALGFFLFDQIPDWLSITGYIIIISMAVISFIYNNRKTIKSEPEPVSNQPEKPQEQN